MSEIYNHVLNKEARFSENFFDSDLLIHDFFKSQFSEKAKIYMRPFLNKTGELAATQMDEWSMNADKFGPSLVKRNKFGETIDEIKFHPNYWDLMQVAIDSHMFRIKWEPTLRQNFKNELHLLGFSAGYLYALSEMGQFCPLCMTDGVARLIDKFCSPEDKSRLLPKIATQQLSEFYTGAMFLTEKSGGSDVGRNIVKARKISDNQYVLNGEKWFCSNANAQIIFALARTDESITGTKGLSIFLVEPFLPNGDRNNIEFVRLKDKLGVRSMASAECIFHNAHATLVGQEFQGFKIMTEMINLSRVYNAVAAISCSRRALVEAFQFLSFRTSFGQNALDHVLIRKKLNELASIQTAGFYVTMFCIQQMDLADNGDEKAASLLRILTPMTKKWTAEKGVYIVRESMELMGGMGYIEDGIMPKLMRDMMVLPIWEGAGNIMTLDMIRAAIKSNGIHAMAELIEKVTTLNKSIDMLWQKLKIQISEQLLALHEEQVTWDLEDELQRLSTFFQWAILQHYSSADNQNWMFPTISYFEQKILGQKSECVSREMVEHQMAWKF
jgi:acyl-CoA dehydrogenase